MGGGSLLSCSNVRAWSQFVWTGDCVLQVNRAISDDCTANRSTPVLTPLCLRPRTDATPCLLHGPALKRQKGVSDDWPARQTLACRALALQLNYIPEKRFW